MSLLQMKHICKSFSGVYANEDINLTVEKGEIHALLGENGAGKTTLVNIIFGLYTADSGEILWKDKPADFASPREAIDAGIGMVQQHFSLVNKMTVLDNIVLNLKDNSFFLDRAAAKKKLTDLAEKYGLYVNPDAVISDLSVGEQQRVEILKALYRNVELLILDEPTAGLDPQGRDDILDQIAALHKMRGITIILVSHSMEDIAKYVERLIVMNHGEMVFDDTPKNVFSHYKELEGMGLAAPQITYIMHALSENGLNVDTTATTVEEARDTILEALKKQKPSLLKKGGRSE